MPVTVMPPLNPVGKTVTGRIAEVRICGCDAAFAATSVVGRETLQFIAADGE
jgi:hypothetical protein